MSGFNVPVNFPVPSRKKRSSRAGGRTNERTELAVNVRIITHGRETQCHEGFCIDISESGIAFLSEAEINMQDLLELTISSGAAQLHHYARLIYRVGPRYGANFIQAD